MDSINLKKLLNSIDELGGFSQIGDITLGECKEYLGKKGLFALVLLIGKATTTLERTDETAQLKIANKYNFKEYELKTLKLSEEGLSYEKIAERLGTITVDGVAKRLKKIRRKLAVSKTSAAVAKAKKEGII